MLNDFSKVISSLSIESHLSASEMFLAVRGLLRNSCRPDFFACNVDQGSSELQRCTWPAKVETAKSDGMLASMMDSRYKGLYFLT